MQEQIKSEEQKKIKKVSPKLDIVFKIIFGEKEVYYIELHLRW